MTEFDPIRNMLFMLLLNDIKNTIKEDPQKAIQKIDNYIKGLKDIEQTALRESAQKLKPLKPPPGQMPERESSPKD